MAQTAMTIRMDQDLKVQFDALCNEFGMSTNTAINIFARAVVRKRRIPFVIEAPAKEDVVSKGKAAFDELRRIAAENGLSGMSLEEINKEIDVAVQGECHEILPPIAVLPFHRGAFDDLQLVELD